MKKFTQKSQISFYRITVFSMLLFYSFLAKANDFSNGRLTIDSNFTSGTLGDTITSIQSNLSEIIYLNIKTGTLNNDDVFWIRDSLTELVTLQIWDEADISNSSLPDKAFLNHKNIQSCYFQDLKSVGNNAFKNCSNLSDVRFIQLTNIGDSAFAGCSNLWKLDPNLTSPPTVGKGTFEGCHYYRQVRLSYEGRKKYMDIDDGNTTDNYWYGFELLVPFENKVRISDFQTGFLSSTVQAHQHNLGEIIELNITGGQLNTTDVYWIRDSLVNLQYLIVNGNATFTGNLVPDNAFKNHNSVVLIMVSTATQIGEHAFDGCTKLISANVSSAAIIGDYAFYNCSNCVQLILTDSPPSVKTNTFSGCTAAEKYIDLLSTSDHTAFRAVNDGNTGDNYWYGWELEWGGSTVIQVNTDVGGNIDWGQADEWDNNFENVNGAMFWDGTDWIVNDTYGHMFFKDLREKGIIHSGNWGSNNDGDRVGNFSGVNTQISGEVTIGNGRIIYGYTISAEEYSYAVHAQDEGQYTYEGLKYSISQPDGTTILLYSRGNGNGTDSACFEIVLEDTSPGPGITTFREGGVISDATGYTLNEAIENPLVDSLVMGRLVTTDLTNHGNRYFIDTNGGNEMGGMSYILETTLLPKSKTIETYDLAQTYITKFSVNFKNDKGELESFILVPLLKSESYTPPNATAIKDVQKNSNELIIYPNPATDVLHIKNRYEFQAATLFIYDLNGKLKISQNKFSKNNINVSRLTPGIYILCLQNREKTFTTRFVKK